MPTKKQMQRLRSSSQYAADKEYLETRYFLKRTGWFFYKAPEESIERFMNPRLTYRPKLFQLNGFNVTTCYRKYKRHMRKVLKSEKNRGPDWLKFGNTDWSPELIQVPELHKEIRVMPRGFWDFPLSTIDLLREDFIGMMDDPLNLINRPENQKLKEQLENTGSSSYWTKEDAEKFNTEFHKALGLPLGFLDINVDGNNVKESQVAKQETKPASWYDFPDSAPQQFPPLKRYVR